MVGMVRTHASDDMQTGEWSNQAPDIFLQLLVARSRHRLYADPTQRPGGQVRENGTTTSWVGIGQSSLRHGPITRPAEQTRLKSG